MKRQQRAMVGPAGLGLLMAAGLAWAQPPGYEWVHADWPVVPDAVELTGERILMEMPEPAPPPGGRQPGADNRVDLVFVGDGYTAMEIPQYQAAAHAIMTSIFSREPLLSYHGHFRVTIVDVVSNESGVDHDPVHGVYKDTALDMEFWCSGLERLLCVDVTKAYNAAWGGGAPDVDQVIAVANSTKYGGAGYVSSNVATVAAGIPQAVEVLTHELGHSLGDLGDEYYTPGTFYFGLEPAERNVSTYPALQMGSLGAKWANWLFHTNAMFDGQQNTYQGAQYFEFGLYRPSQNSIMLSLWRPFNCPSAEAILIEMYKEVSPIDSVIPAAGTAHHTDTLWVFPLMPMEPSFEVRWDLNGIPIPGSDNTPSVDLNTVGLLPGQNTVTVTVWDNTPMVRDEAARTQWMRDTHSWTVGFPCNPADIAPPLGVLDLGDINAFVSGFVGQDPVADINGDGIWDLRDINEFVLAFTAGCP